MKKLSPASKWLIVAGARPNFMKIAPLIHAIRESNARNARISPVIVHTGQHYDKVLSQIFFDDLGIPEPDFNLGIGSGSHAEQTGRIMIAFEQVALAQNPDLVVVAGDVNSTIACALVAAKLSIPVAHIEAGLRSFDKTMPEEINRILTDRISDFLFTPSRDADENLRKEGIAAEKIFFVGNIMVDSLMLIMKHIHKSRILSMLGKILDHHTGYAMITLHRPSNVDDKRTLEQVLGCIKELSRDMPMLFPVHPRTAKQINDFGLGRNITWLDADYHIMRGQNASNIYGLPPLGYLDFVTLMARAKVIFTDSGGIQEESTVLGIPCITLRENTERPVTVTEGTNTITGNDPEKITGAFIRAISPGEKSIRSIPALWDGKTAPRIVEILASKYFSAQS
ncbi:MAG: UDP-N-acetylglucosamine 2-epimerase (non-hydrolyzing) [Nitrospirota bacterium]